MHIRHIDSVASTYQTQINSSARVQVSANSYSSIQSQDKKGCLEVFKNWFAMIWKSFVNLFACCTKKPETQTTTQPTTPPINNNPPREQPAPNPIVYPAAHPNQPPANPANNNPPQEQPAPIPIERPAAHPNQPPANPANNNPPQEQPEQNPIVHPAAHPNQPPANPANNNPPQGQPALHPIGAPNNPAANRAQNPPAVNHPVPEDLPINHNINRAVNLPRAPIDYTIQRVVDYDIPPIVDRVLRIYRDFIRVQPRTQDDIDAFWRERGILQPQDIVDTIRLIVEGEMIKENFQSIRIAEEVRAGIVPVYIPLGEVIPDALRQDQPEFLRVVNLYRQYLAGGGASNISNFLMFNGHFRDLITIMDPFVIRIRPEMMRIEAEIAAQAQQRAAR